MTTQFLSNDPQKALMEIKELLYERLAALRFHLETAEKDEWGYLDFADCQTENEIFFLQNVLDIAERS